ncbi:MAG: MerC domain-containing protein [Flavobacteriales bacterium]|nr:MerC domain-containing protein [Flavobacteriales bacterium]
MTSLFRNIKADNIGVMAGTLCLIHCMITPFIFLAKACSASCCADAPVWWQALDYLFIIVSFGAIFFATKHTSKEWMKKALWCSWSVLFVVLLFQSFSGGVLPEMFVHVPALAIVGLHFYNRRYCGCGEAMCSTE